MAIYWNIFILEDCMINICKTFTDVVSLSFWHYCWRHNEWDGVSNHHCLLNRLFRCKSKKISKLRITGLCVENSPVTGEFPAQKASNAENVSIWCHHGQAYMAAKDYTPQVPHCYTIYSNGFGMNIYGLISTELWVWQFWYQENVWINMLKSWIIFHRNMSLRP